ncbi:MAG: septum formation initiator family protein [Deltaproteobacteria bacterium]|nr:septum formation initiator family protein [Deltaproteobacteria bacterium]
MPRFFQGIAWLLPFTLLVCVVVVVPLRMLDEQGLPRYRALRTELYKVQKANQRMRREVRDLQQTVQRLRSDPVAVERIARDELGMIREGEILFQFPR